MIFRETRIQEFPLVSFLKGTKFNLYVGPKLSWFQRRKLKKVENRYNVLYLYDYADSFTAEKMRYNFPGTEFQDGFSLDTIYDRIRKSIGEDIDPDSIFFIRHDGESFVVFTGGTKSLEPALSYLANNRLNFFEEPCCSYADDDETWLEAQNFVADENLSEDEDADDVRFCIRSCVEQNFNAADAAFDSAMTKAAKDVKNAIEALLMTGFPVEIIESWLTAKVKLSTLRITRQFKILLVDYDKEIKLGPLPKTVFLFYLRHPEGVMFSYLQDHVEELWHIYSHLSVNDDINKMKESVASLADPLSNSICEKCAAIKKAFILQVKDELAKNSYVCGIQGGKKRIALDRNLVEWECEL